MDKRIIIEKVLVNKEKREIKTYMIIKLKDMTLKEYTKELTDILRIKRKRPDLIIEYVN